MKPDLAVLRERSRAFARTAVQHEKVPVLNRVEPKDGADPSTVLLRMYGPIDDWGGPYGVSAQEVADALDGLPDTVETLDVHIHSPGGDAFEGLAILNLLRQHPAKVMVTIDGLAASAASYIAMAGDDIAMAPGSQMMIHPASGMAYGPADLMQQMAALLDKLSANIASIYAARAGGTAEAWHEVMRAETWFTADEAVAAKLADRVLGDEEAGGDPQPTNRFDLKVFTYAGREHAPAPKLPVASAPGSAAAGGTSTEEEVGMSDTLLDGLREQLGLSADADEATVLAKNKEALDALEALNDKPADSPADAVTPAALAEVGRLSTELAAIKSAQAKREKDELIAAWLRDGKTSPAELKLGENDGLEAMYDAAPAQTKALVDARAVGSAVPVSLIGQNQDDEDTEDVAVLDQLAIAAGLPKGALRG